jgi:hypothetical protein
LAVDITRYQNFLRYLQAPQVAKSSGAVTTAPAGQAPAADAAAPAATPAAQGTSAPASGAPNASPQPQAAGQASPPVGKQGWLRLSSQTLGVSNNNEGYHII